MTVPIIPKTMVKLGEAVELDADTWQWTWDKKDRYIVACNVEGNTLYILPEKAPQANPKKGKNTRVQSVLFDAEFWTRRDAKQWLQAHGYATPHGDKTLNWIRYRQAPPTDFKSGSFITISLDERRGIRAVAAQPKRLKNPTRGELEKAKRLFKRFNHKQSRREKVLQVEESTKKAGLGNHIIYISDKFGRKESFIHEFDHKPKIFVDNPRKPRIIVISGKYVNITARGIEG